MTQHTPSWQHDRIQYRGPYSQLNDAGEKVLTVYCDAGVSVARYEWPFSRVVMDEINTMIHQGVPRDDIVGRLAALGYDAEIKYLDSRGSIP